MVKIRKMLTEILLDVTNQEIQSVVTEVYEDLSKKCSLNLLSKCMELLTVDAFKGSIIMIKFQK